MMAAFRTPKKLNRSFAVSFMLFALLALFGAFMALPLIYAVNNAFKPLDELFIFPPRFFVVNPTLENFYDLFALMGNSWVPLTRYIANTLLITLVGTAGHILLASAAIRTPASRLQRTPAQVFFRYLTQQGVVPLTGTTSVAHMREDLAIFEFELTADEQAAVTELMQ